MNEQNSEQIFFPPLRLMEFKVLACQNQASKKILALNMTNEDVHIQFLTNAGVPPNAELNIWKRK